LVSGVETLDLLPKTASVKEAVRPKVDPFLLHFLSQALKKADLIETREGICRVMPMITKKLTTTGPVWARELVPHFTPFARACRIREPDVLRLIDAARVGSRVNAYGFFGFSAMPLPFSATTGLEPL
jgi:hypothetical protein